MLSATPSVDTLSASVNPEQENDTLSVNDENILSAAADSNILGSDDDGSFTELEKLISSSDKELTLNKNYVFQDSDNPVNIRNNNLVIDFKDNAINASNHQGNILTISGNNITLKNLKISNINGLGNNYGIIVSGNDVLLENIKLYDSKSYIIQWTGEKGTLTKADITNINGFLLLQASGDNFKVTYSNFTKSNVLRTSVGQYFVDISGYSSLFSYNNIDEITGSQGQPYAFYFVNSEVSYSNITNSQHEIFISSGYGNCDFHHLLFDNVSSSNYRGILFTSSGSLNNKFNYITFKNCTAGTGERADNNFGAIFWINNPSCSASHITFEDTHYKSNYDTCMVLMGQSVSDITFKNNNISCVYTRGSSSLIENSQFINNNVHNNKRAVIYATNPIVIRGCTFNNNTGNLGGAIYINVAKSSVENCVFTLNNATNGLGHDVYVANSLNVKLNASNDWSVNYTDSVYAPNCYDSLLTEVWVIQDDLVKDNATGYEDSPLNLADALDKVSLFGTIKFTNNNLPYEGIHVTISSPVSLDGNNITITTNLTDSIFVFNQKYVGLVVSNFNFINCSGRPIHYRGFNFTVSNCNFKNITSDYVIVSDYNGGEVLTGSQNIINCNFTQNFIKNSLLILESTGDNVIRNCYFDKNTITSSTGLGLIYLRGSGNANYNISNCNFTDNNIISYSTIVTQPGSTNHIALNVFDCNFTRNNASRVNSAGAIYFQLGNLFINHSNFINNSGLLAGAIYTHNAVTGVDIDDCTFEGNNASNNGGAIYLNSGNTNIKYSTFVGNNVTNNGGAIYQNVDVLTVMDSTFIGNNATNGGAIYSATSRKLIISDDSTFEGNNASNDGGAIYFDGDLSIKNSKFSENYASNNGGAILSKNSISIIDSNFISNTVVEGNGSAVNSEFLTITGGTVNKNTANNGNGSLYITGDASSISSVIFTENSGANGAAIFTKGNDTLIMNSTFTDNIVSGLGGAIYIFDNCSYYIDPQSEKTYNNNTASDMVTKNIYNQYSIMMIGEVYVVLYPEDIEGNNFTGDIDNPIDFASGLSKVAPGGSVIFKNISEIYNATDDFNSVKLNKDGVKIIGNENTTLVNFTVSSNLNNIGLYNLTFTNTTTTVVIVGGNNWIIDNCKFINNGDRYVTNASAINDLGENLTVTNSIFKNNVVGDENTDFGGCILINASRITIDNCTFDNNVANNGAHLFVCENVSGVTIKDSRFYNAHKQNRNGVALLFYNHEGISISGSNFTNNTDNGAMIFEGEVVALKINNNSFINNTAENGGAIYIKDNSLSSVVENTIFFNNSAGNAGGALFIKSGDLSITDASFDGNHANDGGAVYSNASLTINNVRFNNNHADNNGGALFSSGLTNLNNVNFTDNTAGNAGGAIYVDNNARMNVIGDVSLSGNSAGDDHYVDCAIHVSGLFTVSSGVLNRDDSQEIHFDTVAKTNILYVSPNGSGDGFTMQTPANLTSDLVNTYLNNGGKIIFINDQGEFEIDTVTINNLTQITLVGNGSTIKRNINNKYLFILQNVMKS